MSVGFLVVGMSQKMKGSGSSGKGIVKRRESLSKLGLFRVRSFRPARWGLNAHVQTILGSLLPPTPKPAYVRKRLETADDDFIDVDVLSGEGNLDVAVVLCHGLEASSTSALSCRIAGALHDCGWSVYAMNLRGCSGVPNRNAKSYHLGFTDDMRMVVDYAKEQGAKRVYLCGYSLGGNITVKLLGELGDSAREMGIYGGMAFSVPFGSYESSGLLKKGFTKYVYAEMFLRSLKRRALDLYKAKPEEFRKNNIDVQKLLKTKTIQDFDEEFTCKVFGFENTKEYYTKADSKPFLQKVTVPLLVINAKDDPLVYEPALPKQEDFIDTPVILHYTDAGGHCGFMEDARGQPFIIRELVRFFKALEAPYTPVNMV